MMHLPLPPTQQQIEADWAEMEQHDREDWEWFCCLIVCSLSVLGGIGYVIFSSLTA